MAPDAVAELRLRRGDEAVAIIKSTEVMVGREQPPEMTWSIRAAKSAQKALSKFPAKDRDRILDALEEFRTDPFTGDVVRLHEGQSRWRRRVGDYRVFFNIYTC